MKIPDSVYNGAVSLAKQAALTAAVVLCLFFALRFYGYLPTPIPPAPPEPPRPIIVPAVVEAKPCKFVLITAKTDAKVVKWQFKGDSNGADLAPFDHKSTYFVACKEGGYRLQAVASIVGEPVFAECTVHVGGPGPVPPVPPGPDPGPVPPTPDPTDPFFFTLRNAYQLEASPDKAKQVKELAACYRKLANQVGFKTQGEWYQLGLVKELTTAGLVDKLPGVQRAIGNEMNALFPRQIDAPYDQPLVSATLKRFAGLLEVLR